MLHALARALRLPGDIPVCVLDAAWTLLAWNTAWERLCSTSVLAAGRERNMAWRAFTGRRQEWSEREIRFQSSIVTDLRSTTIRYPDDDRLKDVLADLQAASATPPAWL